jgi:hypothetical protein
VLPHDRGAIGVNSPSYANQVNPLKLEVPSWDGWLPFPGSTIPEPLHTNLFFVEQFRDVAFLRSSTNAYFIRQVLTERFSFELAIGEAQAVGEQEFEQLGITVLWAQFTPDPQTLAYEFRDETRWFVPVVKCGSDFDGLPPHMRAFYQTAYEETSRLR